MRQTFNNAVNGHTCVDILTHFVELSRKTVGNSLHRVWDAKKKDLAKKKNKATQEPENAFDKKPRRTGMQFGKTD